MGKTKRKIKQSTGEVASQQLHGIKDGSVKKNKEPKFKNTPTGKVALLKNSKTPSTNVKHSLSPKNIEKHSVGAKGKNEEKMGRKRASKSNAQQLESSSQSEKQNVSSNKRYIYNPDTFRPGMNLLGTNMGMAVSPKDRVQKKAKSTDINVPNILDETLDDDSDESDQDYVEDIEEDEEDDDGDEEGTTKHKGVKMFKGLKSVAEKHDTDTDDSSEDYYDSEVSMLTDESEDEDEETEEEEDNEKQTKDIKDQVDTSSLMVTDEDEYEEDDSEEDDDDDDSTVEDVGLQTLLGKSIADDDDDEDFNEEDEDDDSDISIEEEDDADNDNVVTQAKEITKEKADKDTDKKFWVPFQMPLEERKRCMERQIVVENILPELDMVALTRLFSQYGDIEAFGHQLHTTKIGVNLDGIKRKFSHPLLIIYTTKQFAEGAVRALHGMRYHGNILSIQMSTRYEGPYNPKKTVLVENLIKDVQFDEVWEAFSSFGKIECLRFCHDEKTELCINCRVHFFKKAAANCAVESSDSLKIRGQSVTVSRVNVDINTCGKDGEVENQNETEKPQIWYKKNGSFTQVKKCQTGWEESSKCEENVKKQKQLQRDNEGKKSTAFQGQKATLKNRKKKKLDKKKKVMTEKLMGKRLG